MPEPSAHIDTFCADRLPPREQWPELLNLADFDVQGRLNAATALLDDSIERGWGEHRCLLTDERIWTYADLLELTNRMANVLVDRYGIVPGNRILLRGPNTPMMVATWFATLKVGAVVVATMPMLRSSELTKIYKKCAPTLALCDAALADELGDWVDTPVVLWGSGDADDIVVQAAAASPAFKNVETASDDTALLAFTSGTTGEPKATMHFHRDLMIIAEVVAPLLNTRSDDVFCGSPPLAFTFGLGGLVIFPMHAGASTALTARPGVERLMETIETHRCTVCFTAPTAYRAMLSLLEQHDISSLRRCMSAGETLSKATWDAVHEATGIKIIDGLGATEMLHIFISTTEQDIRPGTTGRALGGYEARVVDTNGVPVPDGQVGALAVRGPTGCRYLDDDRQRTYVRDGWNLTGDAYIRDPDGYFHFQARSDDMIVSSGYNIAAPEVEAALLTHPAVAEVGVIGEPDDERGMVVSAFVCLQEPASASPELANELQEHVKKSIAPYKYPRRIRFLNDPLPKTQTGKLQRFALRDIDVEPLNS